MNSKTFIRGNIFFTFTCIMAQKTVCIVYSFYEKNTDYILNLKYFLKYGYSFGSGDYTFVVNGKSSVSFPKEKNTTVIYRENTGYDFRGYYIGINSLIDRGLYNSQCTYIFLNCTVRGPFLPNYLKDDSFCWYSPFLNSLNGDKHLVGVTINSFPKPHVQSFFFSMTFDSLRLLLHKGLFSHCFESKQDVIDNQEIMMSSLILSNNWNIGALFPKEQIDYRTDVVKCETKDYIVPYDIIFVKTSWPDYYNPKTIEYIDKYTNDFLCIVSNAERHAFQNTNSEGQMTVNTENRANSPKFEQCINILYGSVKSGLTDCTQILKHHLIKNKIIFVVLESLNLNEIFGDPHLYYKKNMWIFLYNNDKPVILSESDGYIVCEGGNTYSLKMEKMSLFYKQSKKI